MTESPAVVKRRQQHERQLQRAGGAGSPRGQALLARWAAEDRAARNGRAPARRSRQMANTSILAVAAVSRGKTNGQAPETVPVAEQIPAPAGERYALVAVDQVDIAPNVRTVIDDASIDELAESIKSVGVLQPIKVLETERGGHYQLVHGQRRLLASRRAGLTHIPALIEFQPLERERDSHSLAQLTENIQREDLNAIEQAKAIRQLLDAEPTLTQAAVAQQLGRSEPWLSNALRLLELAPDVQQLVLDGKLSGAHAKAIAGLTPATQVRLATSAVQYDYSVRSVEQQAASYRKMDKPEPERQEDRRKKSERMAKKLVKLLTAGEVPKDAALVGLRLWEVDEKTVYRLLADAGWTQAGKGSAVGSYGYKPDEIGCDCKAYRHNDYPAPGHFERCCISAAHVDAWQAQKDGAAKQRQKELADKAKRLTVVLQRGLDAIDATTARLAIVAIAGRGLHDIFKGQGDPWTKLEAIPDEQLGFELGEMIAHRLVAGVDAERDYERINSAGVNTVVNRLAAAPAKKGKVATTAQPVETPA